MRPARTFLAGITALGLILSLIVSLGLLAAPAGAAAPVFNAPAFAATWNRTDKAVQDLTGAGRGYTWGPPAPGSSAVTGEPYGSGNRTVQYFDKARMEINNPQGDQSSLYYVTTGLLVKEMVTGARQDGDNSFTRLAPSQVQVAGDSNEGGANTNAPTYASFRGVGTFSGTENSQSRSSGGLITARIDKAGQVTTVTPPEQRLLTGYDSVTGHNIADVFDVFANQSGPVYNGSGYSQGPVFSSDPTYVLGRPLAEPYWTRAVVAGQEKDVLVQLFERRVLTYTPSNPDGFKVEFGNTGQHYFRWRYAAAPAPAVTPTPAPTTSPAPATNPNLLKVDPASGFNGDVIRLSGSGFTPGETLNLWETNPRQEVKGLPSISADAQGNFSYSYQSYSYLAGTWAVTARGLTSGTQKAGYFRLDPYVAGGPARVTLSRTQGGLGTSIDVHGENFVHNEPISIWVTAPDGKVYGGDQTNQNRKATGSGEAHLNYTIPEAKAGRWVITVYGQYSTRTAYATFDCTGQ